MIIFLLLRLQCCFIIFFLFLFSFAFFLSSAFFIFSKIAEHMMFQYYLSLVPTAYFDSSMNYVLTNQYAVTEHRREINHDAGSHGVPG